MKLGGTNFHLILMAALMSAGQALASELISHPIFTQDRKFSLSSGEIASSLTDASEPLDVWIFDVALKNCALRAESVRGQISQILDENSSLWESLDHLFPRSREKIARLRPRVVVDDFSSFTGANPPFSSYFADIDVQTIGLDCRPAEHSYWLRSLAHEMVHLLLNGSQVPSGFEEGLAQWVEQDAGGIQPKLTARHLRNSESLPPLLETRRPLLSRESYAIEYLFVSYLFQEFGGWQVLREMAGTDPGISELDCTTDGDFLDHAICRAQLWLATTSGQSFAASKMTRDGLLRYFYMALSMNDPESAHYQILGWEGFNQLPQFPAATTLLPAQAALFTDFRLARIKTSSTIEAYCVRFSPDHSYKIWPIDKLGRNIPDYCLAINLGRTESPLY